MPLFLIELYGNVDGLTSHHSEGLYGLVEARQSQCDGVRFRRQVLDDERIVVSVLAGVAELVKEVEKREALLKRLAFAVDDVVLKLKRRLDADVFVQELDLSVTRRRKRKCQVGRLPRR